MEAPALFPAPLAVGVAALTSAAVARMQVMVEVMEGVRLVVERVDIPVMVVLPGQVQIYPEVLVAVVLVVVPGAVILLATLPVQLITNMEAAAAAGAA